MCRSSLDSGFSHFIRFNSRDKIAEALELNNTLVDVRNFEGTTLMEQMKLVTTVAHYFILRLDSFVLFEY